MLPGAPQEERDADAQQKLVVILVHGTWGRGFFGYRKRDRPRWFDKDGGFTGRLIQEFGQKGISADFVSISWSGSNSLAERDLASRTLADDLVRLHSLDPHSTKIVIGHSHGGNIALKSLSYLNPIVPKPLIVTIATPFLQIFEWKRSIMSYLMAAVAFIIIVKSTGDIIIDAYLNLVRAYNQGTNPILYYSLLGIGFILSGLLLKMTTSILDLFGAIPGKGYVRILAKFRSHASFRNFSANSPPTLVLRGIDDEASLMLSLGLITTWISRLIFSVVTPLVLLGTLSPWIVEKVVGIGSVSGGHDRDVVSACLSRQPMPNTISPLLRQAVEEYENELCINKILDLLSFWPPIFLATLMFFVSLALSTFGRELFFGGLFCEVNFGSAPDGRGLFEIRTLGESRDLRRLLRHKLYDNAQCAPTIAQWIADRVSRSGPVLRERVS